LAGIIPVVVFYDKNPDQARAAARQHLALTHPGEKMAGAGSLIIHLLLEVLADKPLHETIRGMIQAQGDPLLGHPFLNWLGDPGDCLGGDNVNRGAVLSAKNGLEKCCLPD
jgi:hypothetical protein